jgi:copper oxidase (laccase) domain-containing protein
MLTDSQVSTFTSAAPDGSMKSSDQSYASVLPNRQKFLEKNKLSIDDTTLVRLTYDGDDYTRYKIVSNKDKGDGMSREATIVADALVTTTPGHALFLPLADCIGAVIYDPVKNVLMLSHLGRHNLEQFGGTKSIEFLVENFQCSPKDITVWLSPAAGKDNYPLFAFDNRSMHDVATEQLLAASIAKERITNSSVDTTKDKNYFSHSEYLKGHRDTDGRFAVVTVMK